MQKPAKRRLSCLGQEIAGDIDSAARRLGLAVAQHVMVDT
jgi:hypothetical protein